MKFAIYTGPTIVAEMAEKFREAGLPVTIIGTERVWLTLPEPKYVGMRDNYDVWCWIVDRLMAIHHTHFGITWRDVTIY